MASRKRTRRPTVKAFTERLRAAVVADVESEPEPSMPVLDAALARLLAGGQ